MNLLESIDLRRWLMFSFVSFRASVDEKSGGFGNSTFGVSIMRKIRSIHKFIGLKIQFMCNQISELLLLHMVGVYSCLSLYFYNFVSI